MDIVLQITNIVVAVAAVLAVVLAPRIAWALTRRSQAEDDKRKAKLLIFSVLMEHRHAIQSREAVRALNLIDVAFHDNSEVRRLWQEFHGLITNAAFFESSLGHELTKQKRVELQASMARALGFPVDQFDIQRFYAPAWLREEEDLAYHERKMRLGVLARSRGTPDPSSTPRPSSPIGSIFMVRFEGVSGSQGVGTMFVGTGVIVGGDTMGVRYAGQYQLTDDGRIELSGTLHVPAGVSLVTEDEASLVEREVPFSADLPLDFDEGGMHEVSVGGKAVRAAFERLQVI